MKSKLNNNMVATKTDNNGICALFFKNVTMNFFSNSLQRSYPFLAFVPMSLYAPHARPSAHPIRLPCSCAWYRIATPSLIQPEGGCGGLNKTIISISIGYLPAHFFVQSQIASSNSAPGKSILLWSGSNVRNMPYVATCTCCPPVFDRVGRSFRSLTIATKFRRFSVSVVMSWMGGTRWAIIHMDAGMARAVSLLWFRSKTSVFALLDLITATQGWLSDPAIIGGFTIGSPISKTDRLVDFHHRRYGFWNGLLWWSAMIAGSLISLAVCSI